MSSKAVNLMASVSTAFGALLGYRLGVLNERDASKDLLVQDPATVSRAFDTNNDGIISTGDFYSKLDTNHSGVIDPDESENRRKLSEIYSNILEALQNSDCPANYKTKNN